MNNTTNINYVGNVTLKVKIKNKVITLKNHNAGLDYLMQSFAKFITGNYEGDRDIPKYIDLRTSADNGSTWVTCLTKTLPLSSAYFENDSAEGWIARLTATIKYEILISPISETSTNLYRLYLYSGKDESTPSELYHDLAFMNVSASDLAVISPGTLGIIEWSMKLQNGES